MKAVARLVWSYFTGTPVLRVFSAGGLALIVYSFVILKLEGQSAAFLSIPMFGVLALFVGSSLMPLTFGRMARSHVIRVLPFGRVKLLLSAFITILIIAAPPALIFAYAYLQATDFVAETPAQLKQLAIYRAGLVSTSWLTFTSCFLMASYLYLAMWFITSERTIWGYVKALLVILVLVALPMKGVQRLSVTMIGSLTQIGIVWGAFAAAFLLWPRWKAATVGWKSGSSGGFGSFLKRQVSGREIDLILGTANPWLLAGAQAVPIAFAGTIGFYSSAVWLFYLTMFSTVAGAVAGQAAERSRALWLRTNWSRAELFSHVERSFWRHNSFVLGILLALMVGIGSYTGLPVSLLAAGLPLLALGTTLSTYLGLLITRGLRLPEALLGIGAMVALMAVAVIAARSHGDRRDLTIVIVLEVLLAMAAVVIRAFAKSRWSRIDWMLCRPERALRMRTAS